MPLKIVRNDITKMDTEAIVNTANEHPVVGTGCDYAVYQAAGYEELLRYRKEHVGQVPEGSAFLTPGFQLPAKYIIHAVSPAYRNDAKAQEEKLRACYQNSLQLAKDYQIRSLAFPVIATGSFGFPKEEGVRIAVDEIGRFLSEHEMLVYLVVFGKTTVEIGKQLYPDLETYIDQNYVEQQYQVEYGDLVEDTVRSEYEDRIRAKGWHKSLDRNETSLRDDLEEQAAPSRRFEDTARLPDLFSEKQGGASVKESQVGYGDLPEDFYEGPAAPARRFEDTARLPDLFSGKQEKASVRKKRPGTSREPGKPQKNLPGTSREPGKPQKNLPGTSREPGKPRRIRDSIFGRVKGSAEAKPQMPEEEPTFQTAPEADTDYQAEEPELAVFDSAESASRKPMHRMPAEEPTFQMAPEADTDYQSEEPFLSFDEEHESKLAERIRHLTDTFSEYLLYLIEVKQMENAEVYKRAIVDKKTFSKIKNHADYHPQKLTALCLCIGAKLNLDESKDLLARAGYALSPCDKTDIIFSYFIENEIYDMIELDIQLEEHGLPCIIS